MINNKGCVIIIGGSQSHVPFIEAAQNLGFQAVVFDKDQDCKGAKISDIFYEISTHDIDQIVTKCFEINKSLNLKGAMTFSAFTEPLIAVANTCEKLGLPSFSLNSVELATDKTLMKECFVRSGILTPEWIVVNNLQEAIDYFKQSDGGPLIMKPSVGGKGSKGVALVKKISDILHQYKDSSLNSDNSHVILERYYQGQEFSVDGIVVDQKPIVLSVSEKYNLGPEFNFTMSGFSIGKVADEDKFLLSNIDSIKEISIQSVNAMNVTNSFFSVDVLLTKTGPMVLECGVLLDCKIDRLFKFAGVDVYEMFLKIITGIQTHIDKPEYDSGYDLTFMYADKKGYIQINTDNLDKIDGKIEWERENDDFVKSPTSVSDTVGWLMTKGKDSIDAKARSKINLQEAIFNVNDS